MYTTVWTNAPSVARALSGKTCTHADAHEAVAHGVKPDGTFASSDHAAYPPRLNQALADAIATHVSDGNTAALRSAAPAVTIAQADVPETPLVYNAFEHTPNTDTAGHSVATLNRATATPSYVDSWPAHIAELAEATELHFVCPKACAELNAHKLMSDRKTVVYTKYTDKDGVRKAIEPKGIKEALNSLQKDQWLLAIERELDNLLAHNAFHYVPVKDVLRKGKRIMRNVWIFKIKADDKGALSTTGATSE